MITVTVRDDAEFEVDTFTINPSDLDGLRAELPEGWTAKQVRV